MLVWGHSAAESRCRPWQCATALPEESLSQEARSRRRGGEGNAGNDPTVHRESQRQGQDSAVKLYIAAAICFVIAGGHTFLGHRWILVPLRQDRLPKRLYGGKGMTAITVTFDFVTFAVVGMGVLVLASPGVPHPPSAVWSCAP